MTGAERTNGGVRRQPLHVVRHDSGGDPVLITGGAGFVGCNLADRLLSRGVPVTVFDNLSRAGVEQNLAWLRTRHAHGLHIEIGDVRDPGAVERVVGQARAICHFAAQVAVTTAMADPLADFETNVRGTLNVLDAVRRLPAPPRLIFTSTNKVYGDLGDVALRRTPSRYEPADARLRMNGVGEQHRLDFRGPYGCSKGAADQYVLDHARSYGLDTVVFRMSCVYGERQCGTEDQGWVAHFLLRALEGAPITLFGDGRQVRDLLHIDDLLDAFEIALASDARLSGEAYNIGGGPAHAVSLLEVVDAIGELRGTPPEVRIASWRAGDQRYYVSDIRRFGAATGWQPRVSPATGIRRLHDALASAAEREGSGLQLVPGPA